MTDHCLYCKEPLSPEKIRKKAKFCSDKHKAAYHRAMPFKDALQVKVKRSITTKRGIVTTIQIDFSDREKHAKLMTPDRVFYVIPVMEDLPNV